MPHDGVLNLRHVDGVAESTKTMMMVSKISVFFSFSFKCFGKCYTII